MRKSIIRTTIKNENLLAKKLELEKIKKKGTKRKGNLLKHKVDRNSKLDGILATKIQQSVDRAKYIQNARKSDWDRINTNINIVNHFAEDNKPSELTEKQKEKAEEDAYVEQFFADDSEPAETANPENHQQTSESKPSDGNRFSLLEEQEA